MDAKISISKNGAIGILALFINRTSQTSSTNNLCPSPAIIFGHDVRFGAAFPRTNTCLSEAVKAT